MSIALNRHGVNLFSSGRHEEAIPVIRDSLACLEEGPQEFLTLIIKANSRILHKYRKWPGLLLSVADLAHLGVALREENFTLNRNEVIHCLKESVAIGTEISAARKEEFSLGTPLQEFYFCPHSYLI